MSRYDVKSGVTSTGKTLNNDSMYVSKGGVAVSTTVNSGGSILVSSGGIANNTAVNNWGDMGVSFGGAANYATVNFEGYLLVFSDGTANNTTVNSQGYFYVYDGGTANSATVKDWGNMYVFSVGKLTGQMIFVENAVVSVEEGAILDFDISELTADAGARVNNLSIIQGTPLYTLTVDGLQADGTYKLAGGAAGFDKTISVRNPEGTNLGTLTVGAWLDGTSQWALLSGNFGGDFWQMVGCGDFDGDGKDSVLMSGGNGQMLYSVGLIGEVKSHGSADWSGWDVRAIGDFAGDGRDDIVLFHSTLGAMALLVDGNADNYVSLGQLDPNDWFVVGAGDYNNDQKDDLLVRQKSTGMLGYYNACDTSETGWVEMGRGVDLNWTVIA